MSPSYAAESRMAFVGASSGHVRRHGSSSATRRTTGDVEGVVVLLSHRRHLGRCGRAVIVATSAAPNRSGFRRQLENGQLRLCFVGMSNCGKSFRSSELEQAMGFQKVCIDDLIEEVLVPELAELGYSGIEGSQGSQMKRLSHCGRNSRLVLLFYVLDYSYGSSLGSHLLYKFITNGSIFDLLVPILISKGMASWMGFPYHERFQKNERRYLELEEQLTSSVEPPDGSNFVLDTTGSVVYMPQPLLRRLREHFLIVHFNASDAMLDNMIEQYFETPKPVSWGGLFHRLEDENPDQALRRYEHFLDPIKHAMSATVQTTYPDSERVDPAVE